MASSRPAQGNNSGFREDPKWAPKAQPAPRIITTGSVSKPKSGAGRPRYKAQPGPSRKVNNPGPAV